MLVNFKFISEKRKKKITLIILIALDALLANKSYQLPYYIDNCNMKLRCWNKIIHTKKKKKN
jgi:hypothetical protein